jgi:hypothetical protein
MGIASKEPMSHDRTLQSHILDLTYSISNTGTMFSYSSYYVRGYVGGNYQPKATVDMLTPCPVDPVKAGYQTRRHLET